MARDLIRYIAVLEEIAATVAAALIEEGIPAAEARAMAEKAADRVQQEFGGGQPIYIPKGTGYQVARRNAEIRRLLTAGGDRTTIRREFDLTEERLRQIEADEMPSRR